MLLDSQGRLWKTRNGGRSVERGALRGRQRRGSAGVRDPDGRVHGRARLRRGQRRRVRAAHDRRRRHLASAGADARLALLRVRWSQAAASTLPRSSTATRSAAKQLDRLLFTTTTRRRRRRAARRRSALSTTADVTEQARAAQQRTTRCASTGTLSGALGGETIVVSRRDLAGGSWHTQQVVAGANGGSFATTWQITRSSVFVAQWAGDSGRPGLGSKVLKVLVG